MHTQHFFSWESKNDDFLNIDILNEVDLLLEWIVLFIFFLHKLFCDRYVQNKLTTRSSMSISLILSFNEVHFAVILQNNKNYVNYVGIGIVYYCF